MTFSHRQAKKEKQGKRQKPLRERGCGNQRPGDDTASVEHRKNKNVEQGNLFEIERVHHCKSCVSEQQQAKFGVEQKSHPDGRKEQYLGGQQSFRNGNVAGCEGSLFLPRMLAIGMEIEKIVENVESGGTKAVECETHKSTQNRPRRKIVRQREGQEEQQVL